MTSPLLAFALLALAAEPGAANPGEVSGAPPAATAETAPAQTEPDTVQNVPGLDGAPVRVERRALVKAKKAFLTGGLTYLSRGDYWTSPGLTANFGYYPLEQHGLEFNVNLFVSFMSPGAAEIYSRTGLVPDAQRPIALLGIGYRYGIGYGKAIVGPSLDGLVHFDVQATAHAGLTITDRGANPTVGVGPALVVRFSKLLVLQLDVPLQFALEARTRSFFTFAVQPRLAMGVML